MLNDKQQFELENSKNRCLIILNFFISKGGNSPLFDQFKEIISETYSKKNLKGIRILTSDINGWVKGLNQVNIDELNEILHKHYLKGLDDENEEMIIKVSQILMNGKIKNDDEYRLLQNRVEQIYGDNNDCEEVKKINNLLVKFQK